MDHSAKAVSTVTTLGYREEKDLATQSSFDIPAITIRARQDTSGGVRLT